MASKARTPENFPRMKVRGKGRRAMHRYQEVAAALAALSGALPGVMAQLAEAFVQVGTAAVEAARALVSFYSPAPRQSDYTRWPPAGAHLEGERPSHVWIDEGGVKPFGVNWDTINGLPKTFPPGVRLHSIGLVDLGRAFDGCIINLDEVEPSSDFDIDKIPGSSGLIPRNEEKGSDDD